MGVRVYATSWCGYCRAAKRLLAERGIPFEEIDLTSDDAERARVQARWGWSTVPVIVVDEVLLGGYSELAALDRKGELEHLRSTLPPPRS
jgi:glutaredoxin 3